MLTRLQLQNFKSTVDQATRVGPLTLLVGANAAGKSNFLDALRFLQGLGLDLPIAEILRGRWEGGREIWPGIRGGIAEAARVGTNEFTITSRWGEGGYAVEHSITCVIEPEPAVTRESLIDPNAGTYFFDTHAPTLGTSAGRAPSGALRVGLKGRGGGRNPTAEYSSARSLLGQLQQVQRMDPAVMLAVTRVRQRLQAAVFLSITPSRMRDYVPRAIEALGASGENISAVLHRLAQDPERAAELQDWLTELCAPEVKELTFTETDLKDVMLGVVEHDGGRVSARSMSDGTLRFLGELVALRTAPKGATLLMEEIENGLHPARASLLVELLETATRNGERQVIATTHSPVILAALSPPTLRDVILFGRASQTPGTRMQRLGDLPRFDEVVQARGIEHLFTTRWMEQAL